MIIKIIMNVMTSIIVLLIMVIMIIMITIMIIIMMINIGTVCKLVSAVHLILLTTAEEDPTIHSPDKERRLSHVPQIFAKTIWDILSRSRIWYLIFEINDFKGRAAIDPSIHNPDGFHTLLKYFTEI